MTNGLVASTLVEAGCLELIVTIREGRFLLKTG